MFPLTWESRYGFDIFTNHAQSHLATTINNSTRLEH